MPTLNPKRIGPLKSWSEIQECYDRHFATEEGLFVFRGHTETSWRLETSLERAWRELGDDAAELQQIEDGLIRRFQRAFHQYVPDAPRLTDMPEWLAAMQHFGAPTRLLDVTYSFFVALFFAVEFRSQQEQSAIWAFDLKRIAKAFKDRYPIAQKILNGLGKVERDRNLSEHPNFRRIMCSNLRGVCPLSPFRVNERINIQQGCFLVPGDVKVPFEDNLAELKIGTSDIVKIEIAATRKCRQEVLRRLHRMNMSRATLFPGLPGFAESLKTSLALPGILRCPPNEAWSGPV